jgi:hypothetical protein
MRWASDAREAFAAQILEGSKGGVLLAQLDRVVGYMVVGLCRRDLHINRVYCHDILRRRF